MNVESPLAAVGASTDPVPASFAAHLPPALASLNVPAYVLDLNGDIRWLNHAARALTGDAVGRHFTDVVTADQDKARSIFERRLSRLEEGDHSVTLIAPDGTHQRVDVSSVPLGQDHQVVGMFGLAIPSEPPRPPRSESPLTRRQQEVLEMLAHGTSTAAIAERLFLSEQTVRNHVRQILQRLGTNSRLAAVAAARREGIV